MPNPPRQFELGGIYHIFNRGVEKREIFSKKQDYSRFVLGLYFFNDKTPRLHIWDNLHQNKKETFAILAHSEGARMDFEGAKVVSGEGFGERDEVVDKRKRIVDLLAFALMPNHFHFLVRESSLNGISLFMQKMGGYTLYFNKQYDRVGPLFQGRYKAVQIKDELQLVNIFSYVHTNPVELKEHGWKNFEVRNKRNAIHWLENYRWSSYLDYIGQQNFPYVTQREFFKEILGGPNECRKIVEDWIGFKAENIGLNEFLGA